MLFIFKNTAFYILCRLYLTVSSKCCTEGDRAGSSSVVIYPDDPSAIKALPIHPLSCRGQERRLLAAVAFRSPPWQGLSPSSPGSRPPPAAAVTASRRQQRPAMPAAPAAENHWTAMGSHMQHRLGASWVCPHDASNRA